MTANDFVKIVRSGGDKLRVDEVVVSTGTQELHGKGMLKINRTDIQGQIAEKGDGYRRLINVVRSAQPYSMQQMIQALASHFELQWQGDMENIYSTWSRARHPLVHEKPRAETTEDKLKESVRNESQIAGGINILLLKLFGYSGWLRHSALEDGYRKI